MGFRERRPGNGVIVEAPRPGSFWAGAALLALGLLTVGAVLYLGDTSAPAAERLYFALGLPGMAFLSLAGQVMGTIGLVILWHWRRRTGHR